MTPKATGASLGWITRTALLTLVLASTQSRLSLAEEEAPPPFVAEVAVVSDYVYRGLTLTDGDPALQGTLTWTHSSGIHLAGWASTINFAPGDPAKAELQVTGGYGGTVGNVAYDAGVLYIIYPGAPKSLHYDYLEAYGTLSTEVSNVTLRASANYTPAYFGDTGHAWFLELGGDVPVAEAFKLSATLGTGRLEPIGGDSYFYWNAGAAYTWRGVTAALRYHGNDLKDCPSCKDRVVLSLSTSF